VEPVAVTPINVNAPVVTFLLYPDIVFAPLFITYTDVPSGVVNNSVGPAPVAIASGFKLINIPAYALLTIAAAVFIIIIIADNIIKLPETNLLNPT
jgi:hypothetical protein